MGTLPATLNLKYKYCLLGVISLITPRLFAIMREYLYLIFFSLFKGEFHLAVKYLISVFANYRGLISQDLIDLRFI